MTTPLGPIEYADIEALLSEWLTEQCQCRVLTDLPANLQEEIPLIQITRYGGGDYRPGLDLVLLDVDAYGPDRATAVAYAEKARSALRFVLPSTQIDNVVFTQVTTLESPSYRPYDDTDLRRFGGSYELLVHMVAT